MRFLVLIALVFLAACSSKYHELPSTEKGDPIWQLNDGKWNFNENELVRAPARTMP
jgi:outer membrane biogenesis lipoprotein LolB